MQTFHPTGKKGMNPSQVATETDKSKSLSAGPSVSVSPDGATGFCEDFPGESQDEDEDEDLNSEEEEIFAAEESSEEEGEGGTTEV